MTKLESAPSSLLNRSTPLQWVARSAILAVVYYAVARVGLLFQLPDTIVSPFSPSSGVALPVLLAFGLRLWPGIAAGALLTNLSTLPLSGSGVVAACVITAGSTLEQMVAWLLFNRLTEGRKSFERLKDVYWFAAV